MPNVPILALKNIIPRVASAEALTDGITATEAAYAYNDWPFGTFTTEEAGYDLPAVLLARATEWEVVLALDWTAVHSVAGDTYTTVASFEGTENVVPAVTTINRTEFVGITSGLSADPVPAGATDPTLQEESLAHEDAGLNFFGGFSGASFPTRSYSYQENADPPVDFSANLDYGIQLSSEMSVFGGNRVAPGFFFIFTVGFIPPSGNPNGIIVSAGPGAYEEELDMPTVSSDSNDFEGAAYVECGTLTIIWYHCDGGTATVSCPLYAFDVSAYPIGGSTFTRTVTCSITLTQKAGLRYGDTYLASGEKA